MEPGLLSDFVTDVRVAASEARACPTFDEARRLATWLGPSGRPITPKGVLRPSDVPEIAQVLGGTVPPKFRSAADLPWLHEPWTTAVDSGLVVVRGSAAFAGEALAESADEAVLGLWWRAFRPRIEAWDDADDPWSGKPTAPVAALRLLVAEPDPVSGRRFTSRIRDLLMSHRDVVLPPFWRLANGDDEPADVIVTLLSRFGTMTSTRGKVEVSALGRWALEQVTSLTPRIVTSTMTAAEVLATVERLDEDLAWRRAGPWLGARPPVTAARQLLVAAASASPMHRMIALSLAAGLGDGALPAWRAAATFPQVGPAARAFLFHEFGGPEPTAQDAGWQLVDECAALLDEEEGPDAVPGIWDDLPGTDVDEKIRSVEASGHPEAGRLVDELRRYALTGDRRPTPPVYQLKVSLRHVQPPVWRRVEVDGDIRLGDLQLVIQAVMGWDGDHLHQFTVNGRDFSDPAYGLEVADEWRADLADVLPRPGVTADYLYDFGDSWRHTIKVEKIHDAEPDMVYPRCVGGKGTRPGEDGGEPEPFDLDRVNRRLNQLRHY